MSTPIAKVIIGDCRKMLEIGGESIDLVVTSPPYWYIKDYGIKNQIGYGQTLHEYLKDLFIVWKECFRILKPGTRLCINIGDQFLRSTIFGRYKIVPLHSEIIAQCEQIGFDYMGTIIWHKPTTRHTTGGATIMGSYPYPGGGIIEENHEYILVFKKLGKRKPPPSKETSKLSKEEWKEYFSGYWNFPGERQGGHTAMFPEELPRRLIKMFSFIGDTVVDPFLGSGTTIKAALELGRNAIGYEINENFIDIIKKKVGKEIEIIKRTEEPPIEKVEYRPSIQNMKPLIDPKQFKLPKEDFHRVVEIIDKSTLKLEDGTIVGLLGVEVIPSKEPETLDYLSKYILKKRVFLRFDDLFPVLKMDVQAPTDIQKNKFPKVFAYVYTKNKIFVNREMIKLKLAKTSDYPFKYRNKFLKLEGRTV